MRREVREELKVRPKTALRVRERRGILVYRVERENNILVLWCGLFLDLCTGS